MRMTTEEAFVKTLQLHGIEHVFGIIGSAFMPISDYFPQAGIKFWDCAHEGSGGMMADGFTRASGKMCMMIAQNGPGITNFVTAVKTALAAQIEQAISQDAFAAFTAALTAKSGITLDQNAINAVHAQMN